MKKLLAATCLPLLVGFYAFPASASGLRLPKNMEPVVSHASHNHVITVHSSRGERGRGRMTKDMCQSRISNAVWMNVIRSEAMITAISCGKTDDYNSVMTEKKNRYKFASVSMRRLIKARTNDPNAEVANRQSLHDSQKFGDAICQYRQNIFADMAQISNAEAMNYVIAHDIDYGDSCEM